MGTICMNVEHDASLSVVGGGWAGPV